MTFNPKRGDRVTLAKEFGDYPLTPIPAGRVGTVRRLRADCVEVMLDDYERQLDSWFNVLQVAIVDADGQRLPDFANPAERILEPTGEANIVETMTGSNYQEYHTGGGCMAWHRDLDGGGHIWICTDDQDVLGDPLRAQWLVGRYAPDDNGWVCCEQAFTLSRAMDLAGKLPDPRGDERTLSAEEVAALDGAKS